MSLASGDLLEQFGQIMSIAEDDILIMHADPNDLSDFLDGNQLELVSTASATFIQPDPEKEIMSEGVVKNDSLLIGRGVETIRRLTGRTLALVGLARQGRPVTQRLRQQEFKAGDVLLLHGNSDSVYQQFEALGLWPLMRRQIRLNRNRQIVVASAVFFCRYRTGNNGCSDIAYRLFDGNWCLCVDRYIDDATDIR